MASVFLFIASAWTTIGWSASMSTMQGGMPMPGSWTMSTAWMPIGGQSWVGRAVSFMEMWVVMMVAMMLPSLVPMLARYRCCVITKDTARLNGLTAIAGAAYFLV